MSHKQTEQSALQADQAKAKNESRADMILILSGVLAFLFLSFGAYLIYAPLGFIVAGFLLLAFSIAVAKQIKGAGQ